LKKILSDPLVRRFFSAAFFASAFVWVAVEFFDVEIEIVKVLFIYSIGFILLMVIVGLVLFPFLSLFRKKRSSLLESAIDNVPSDSVPSDSVSSDNVPLDRDLLKKESEDKEGVSRSS
jgi:hypothetical protein